VGEFEMRMKHVIICGGLLGLTGASWALGCTHYVDDYYTPLTQLPDSGTTTSSSSSSGAGGDDGGPPPGCIPSENIEAVADTCGVFVSSSKGSDANGDGSKGKPFASITKALTKNKTVYACGETFAETLSLTSNATLYGGLICTNEWKYDASAKTKLAPTTDAIPLTVSTATTSVEVFDFAITAVSAKSDGGSSIAVLVTQAAASFVRCDVAAGDGKAGTPGAAAETPGTTAGTAIAGAQQIGRASCRERVFQPV
jgi:hypothetical protein